MFFGYPKYHSIAAMLLDLKQLCFDAVVHNFRHACNVERNSCTNEVIQYLSTVIIYSIV